MRLVYGVRALVRVSAGAWKPSRPKSASAIRRAHRAGGNPCRGRGILTRRSYRALARILWCKLREVKEHWFAEAIEAGAAVHLTFDHLDALGRSPRRLRNFDEV
jgi:hypothetical protein